jgi:outer membrane receptor protein involved in Fe transport
MVLLFASFASVFAQTKVSGTVADASGSSIPGVSVIEKGTVNGITTDMDGKFTLTVSNSNAVLQFSFVGMSPVEEALNGRTTINVVMSSSAIGLDEVVVTALGIQRDKKTLTYASQQVTGEELMKARGTNFMENLSGKTAGLEIEKSASGAGGSTRVILRGFKSLGGSSEPLYVIDGIPVMNIKRGQPGMWGGADNGDGLSQLNPDDIESINVFKGIKCVYSLW